MRGIQLSGKAINTLSCYLTQHNDAEDKPVPRRFRIVDKHGLSRHAYNLQIDVELDDRELALGLGPDDLPQRGAAASAPDVPERETADAPSAEELFDDLASLLKKRSVKTITED
jgi:hypothetical protein